MTANPVTIRLDATRSVSGILQLPPQAFACYVMAHGAGAGMAHRFMTAVADGLSRRGIATLRFQFPYMEAGSKRPDRPAVAQAAVRAAVEAATAQQLPLFAGGKSFGGRMTSQAQAATPLPGVRGLVFFGFPLHPANRPSVERAAHLSEVRVPMLFLQGTSDSLADTRLIGSVVAGLGAIATLTPIENADHSFHVPQRSGRTDGQVLEAALDAVADWMGEVLGDRPGTGTET